MNEALHLVARIAGRAVAVLSDQVDSVVDLGPVTPVPLAAPGVIGLAALRSRVVTVIDPRIALGVPADAVLSRAIVAQVDGHAYAVLVDALEDVAGYRTLPLPAGVAMGGTWALAGSGLLDRPGEPVLVVDIARLVPDAVALAA